MCAVLNLSALEAARRFNSLNGISCLQYVLILLFGVFRRVEYDACSVRKQEPNNFSLCSLGTWSKMGIDSTRLSSHFWLTALTGHRATASQQGTKSERWAATHKYDGRSDWSGAQKDSHLEMAQSQKVGQWQDQKKDHWMAASNWDGWQQVSNCGELQNFQRPRATFPPPSPSSHQHPFSKELSGLSHFGLIDRPIAIASFCRAEKKIISVSILCQASKTPSIEARKHKKIWNSPTSRVKKKIYLVFNIIIFFVS